MQYEQNIVFIGALYKLYLIVYIPKGTALGQNTCRVFVIRSDSSDSSDINMNRSTK